MPERIIAIMTPVKARWDALTRRQKIQLVSAVAILLVALIIFLYFTLRPRMVALYANRDHAFISQVENSLTAAGIRNTPSSDYTSISVRYRDSTAAKGIVLSNVAEARGITLEDALDLTGLGSTESERSALLLEAEETKIAETLVFGFEAITGARVKVTPAERNLLLRPNQPPAVMSVTLTTNRSLSQSEGRHLAESLRTMVRGLELENITIMDQHMNPVFMGSMIPDENMAAMDVQSMRHRRETQMTDTIEAAVLSIADDVMILSNFVYEDWVNKEERIMLRTAPDGTEDGLPTFNQISRSEAEGITGVPWEAGIGSNQQAWPGYQMGGPYPTSASTMERLTNFVHNEYETIIHRGPGDMVPERSNISINVVFDHVIDEAKWMERHPDATRADWLAYSDSYPSQVMHTDPELTENLRMFIATGIGLPPSNVWVVISERFSIVEIEESPLPIATIVMLIVLLLLIAMLLIALLARRKEEEEEDVEPELSVEDLLATTQLEEAKEEASRLEEIDYEKENEIKKQIEKFVNEKPESVAALLRNWLNAEEW